MQPENQYEIEQRALLAELRAVGVEVRSVSRFGKEHRAFFNAAIPVLLSHLNVQYSDPTRESIARALGRTKDRDKAWKPVLSLYLKELGNTKAGFKHGLAAALSDLAAPSDVPTLIELVDDRKHGISRAFFIHNLAKSKNGEALACLLRNQNDQDIAPEIVATLKRKEKRAKRDSGGANVKH